MKKFVVYADGFKYRTFNTKEEMEACIAEMNAAEEHYTYTHAYYYGREEEIPEPMTLEEIETKGRQFYGEKAFEAKIAFYTDLGNTRERALRWIEKGLVIKGV